MKIGKGVPRGDSSLRRFIDQAGAIQLLEEWMKQHFVGPSIAIGRDTDTSVSDATTYTVVWETTWYEDPSSWWTSGTDLTVPYDGIYHIQAYADWASGAGLARHETRIYHAGNIVGHVYEPVYREGAHTPEAVVSASKGDILKLTVLRDADDDLNGTLELARMSVVRLAR